MATANRKVLLEHFKKPEGTLGELVSQHMEQEYDALNQWAIEMLSVNEEDKILEIGFGTGRAIEGLAEIATHGLVAGIDYSELMLLKAQKRNTEAILEGRVDLQHANVSELPDFGVNFDKILAINSMMYWDQPVEVLKQLKSMLSSDGIIAISWMRGAYTLQTGECNDEIRWYVDCLQQAGFTSNVEFQPLEKQYKPLECIRFDQMRHYRPFNVMGICVIGAMPNQSKST